MAEKKYQVFISSTYADLKEERRKILDFLLKADCIPAGMEAFVASDVEQFEVIKKVIDLCDYYILIIGKRYGSINEATGLSYTEMEYDYAIKQGIPVLVFVLDESVNLTPVKTEDDPEKNKLLDRFRTKALKNRLATIWKTTDELVGNVAISIMNAKTEFMRPGWQRATEYDEASLRREIMDLQKENAKLSEELSSTKNELLSFIQSSDVAFEDCNLKISYYYYDHYNQKYNRTKTVELTQIFKIIAIEMFKEELAEHNIETILSKQLFTDTTFDCYFSDEQLIKRILIQLNALGLIETNDPTKRGVPLWSLTSKGEKLRDEMVIIKTTKK